jgi:signal transduction histidine kinase
MLGEPEQLERLVRNILDNAIRHAPNRVRLSVDAAAPDTIADAPGGGALVRIALRRAAD